MRSEEELPGRNYFLRMVAGCFEGLHPILLPLFALFAGMCLRGLYLYDLSSLPVGNTVTGPDVSEYYEWACRILAGEILPRSVPIHAPVYPFFLALLASFCDHNIMEMRLLQSVLLMTLTVIPVYYSLRVIFFASENRTMGRPWTMRFIPFASTWILALYPPLALYQAEFFAEPLMCVFEAFAVWFMLAADKATVPVRIRYFALAGIFCALAILTHPASVIFAGFVFAYLLIQGIIGRGLISKNKKLPAAFVFLLPVLLLTFGWSTWVSHLAGHPVFVQGNSGFNFYLGNRKHATGACDVPPGPQWHAIHAEAAAQAKKRNMTADQVLIRETLVQIRREPGAALALLCRKMQYILSASELSTWSDVIPLKRIWSHRFLFDHWFLLLSSVGGIMMLVRLFNRRFLHDMRYFILLGTSVVVAQLLTVCAGRYRLGLLIPLAAFAAVFLVSPALYLKKRRLVALCIGGLMIASGFTGRILDVARRPVLQEYGRILLGEAFLKQKQYGNVYSLFSGTSGEGFYFSSLRADLLGRAAMAEGKKGLAEKYLLEGLKASPEDFALLSNYGIFLMDSGKWKQAETMFGLASRVPCSRADRILLEYNYGLLAQRSGNAAEAERRYYAVLARDPLYGKALNNCGVLLIGKRKYDAAVSMLERACGAEPGKDAYYVNLALAQNLAGRKKEAAESCAKALKLNPGSVAAKQLMQEFFPEKK